MFESQSEERTPSDNRTSNPSPPLTFPEKIQYPKWLPKGLTLTLHPSARRQSSARTPKPRPLHGFAQPALTPLAKAPSCPPSTVNLLPKVPALSSQGVILLTQTPCIPVNGNLPVSQVTSTPAHGTVPLSSVSPVNFQYVVPQLGCINPVEPPASLPSAVVKIPSTSTVTCKNSVSSSRVVTTCAIKSVPKKVYMPKKGIVPRKLLPIQPTLFNPVHQLSQLIPLTPGARVSMNLEQSANANFAENMANTAPSMVIIPSSLLDNATIHPQVTTQGCVKSSNSLPSQDSTPQPISTLPHHQSQARPLLPGNNVGIRSPDCPKQPAESEFKLKSSPLVFSHTPSPPLQAVENLNASPAMLTIDQQEHSWQATALHKVNCDVPMTDFQSAPSLNTLDSNLNTKNVISSSVLPQYSSAGTTLPANSLHNLSSFTNLPVDNSQAASHGGAPQFLLVPKTNLIPNQPMLHLDKGDGKVKQDNVSLDVGLPSEGAPTQVISTPCISSGADGVWKEEVEIGAEVGGEEMAGAFFGNPFLTLSESSSSPSLSSSNVDSSAEASESSMEERKYSPSLEEQRAEELASYSGAKNKEKGSEGIHAPVIIKPGQVSGEHAVPGLLTFTSGTERQETSGGGDEQNEGNQRDGQEGAGQQNGESRGDEGRDGDEQNKRGDGEGDGNRGRQGNEGDKNDDEKDGEREEEEEDFDELTQDEDEEEVMSSASEESVLSVPELQVCAASLTSLNGSVISIKGKA